MGMGPESAKSVGFSSLFQFFSGKPRMVQLVSNKRTPPQHRVSLKKRP